MVKGIFATKQESGYKDITGVQYHFPRQYLKRVEACLGDHVIFYEPKRADGRRSYFGWAIVASIQPDEERSDHYFAYFRNYLDFDQLVFFRHQTAYWESGIGPDLQFPNLGFLQNAVRHISEADFDALLNAGFAVTLSPERAAAQGVYSLQEEAADFARPVVERLISQPVRERSFALHVRNAYDATCAVSRLRIINGGGRAEMEAAHIKPVADNGPDSVGNGLALSRTFHWMFDRGIISATDDYRLLVAERYVDDAVRRLLPNSGQLAVPTNPSLRPDPRHLAYHRQFIFKGAG